MVLAMQKAPRQSLRLFSRASIKRTWRLQPVLNSKFENTETIRSSGHIKANSYKRLIPAALTFRFSNPEREDPYLWNLITSSQIGTGLESQSFTWQDYANYSHPRKLDAPPRVTGSGQPKLCLRFSILTDASEESLLSCHTLRKRRRNVRSLMF